jgi:hypothetical protein
LRPFLEKTHHLKRAGIVAQGVGPEFTLQYHKKRKTRKEKKERKEKRKEKKKKTTKTKPKRIPVTNVSCVVSH